VVFGVNAAGEYGHPWIFGKDLVGVYVPIAHNRILSGVRADHSVALDARALNVRSVSTSLEFFVASRNTSVEQSLQKLVGTAPAILSEEDIAEVVEMPLHLD
jgi:hypothetical protein